MMMIGHGGNVPEGHDDHDDHNDDVDDDHDHGVDDEHDDHDDNIDILYVILELSCRTLTFLHQ